jgi:Ser/Thr protein kinase RdoA (MazF antagonist)
VDDRTGHEALALTALRRLGREQTAASVTVRLLTGGLSGSSVYHLDLAGEEAVLKLTLPGRDRRAVARARREAQFYSELATRVPVSVPHVLGLDLNETAGIAVLLAAYAPSPPPDRWTQEAYAQVARQLGRLHAAFWDKTAVPAVPAWLRATPKVTLARCRDAAATWHALGERDDLREVLAPYGRRLERLVTAVPALEPRMTTVPATLCHGDFHAGNLLRGPDGEWIWADWQEVRLGPGVDDLAFFWQRAFVASATPPPHESMVQAYAAGLATSRGGLVPPARLDQALAWAELRLWLVDWPGYLGALSVTRMERVLRRIETLIDQMEVAGHLLRVGVSSHR